MNWDKVIINLSRDAKHAYNQGQDANQANNPVLAQGHLIVGNILLSLAEALKEGIK